MLNKVFAVAVMLTAGASGASAIAISGPCDGGDGYKPPTWSPPTWSPPSRTSAPEIDPASLMTGLTLLAGGLVVLRGRKGQSAK